MPPRTPDTAMTAASWKSIRLELGKTADFPRGSASRVYLLRLPLDAAGLIDAAAVVHMPARATVRRFWPSQADLSGNIVNTSQGWAFDYGRGNPVCQPDAAMLHLDKHVLLTEPDGSRLPFRVASLARIS